MTHLNENKKINKNGTKFGPWLEQFNSPKLLFTESLNHREYTVSIKTVVFIETLL